MAAAACWRARLGDGAIGCEDGVAAIEYDNRQELVVQAGTEQGLTTSIPVAEIHGRTDTECCHLRDAGSLVVQTPRRLRFQLLRKVDEDESRDHRDQKTDDGEELDLQRLVPRRRRQFRKEVGKDISREARDRVHQRNLYARMERPVQHVDYILLRRHEKNHTEPQPYSV